MGRDEKSSFAYEGVNCWNILIPIVDANKSLERPIFVVYGTAALDDRVVISNCDGCCVERFLFTFGRVSSLWLCPPDEYSLSFWKEYSFIIRVGFMKEDFLLHHQFLLSVQRDAISSVIIVGEMCRKDEPD